MVDWLVGLSLWHNVSQHIGVGSKLKVPGGYTYKKLLTKKKKVFGMFMHTFAM